MFLRQAALLDDETANAMSFGDFYRWVLSDDVYNYHADGRRIGWPPRAEQTPIGKRKAKIVVCKCYSRCRNQIWGTPQGTPGRSTINAPLIEIDQFAY